MVLSARPHAIKKLAPDLSGVQLEGFGQQHGRGSAGNSVAMTFLYEMHEAFGDQAVSLREIREEHEYTLPLEHEYTLPP